MKNIKTKKTIIIIIHFALWVCFLLLPYFFFQDFKELPEKMSNRILTYHSISSIYLIAFYYLNTLLFIPKFLYKSKWLFYILLSVIFFIGYMYVPKAIVDQIAGPPGGPPSERKSDQTAQSKDPRFHGNTTPFYKHDGADSSNRNNRLDQRRPSYKNNAFFKLYFGPYAVFLLVFTIGTCLSVMQRWRSLEKNKEEIEKEKLNTELSFLKSQVNPHFFFNTLNNIYSLAVVGSEHTAPAVLQLSSIMRYILTETQKDKVPLQNEIDFIKNYIELQLVRVTDKVHVDFVVQGNTEEQLIAPLLFIPFVENAFKYGISTKDKTSIEIKLKATKQTIHFEISNSIVKAENAIHDATGIGINNVKRRLELLYNNKHTLTVKELNNTFTVNLDINL